MAAPIAASGASSEKRGLGAEQHGQINEGSAHILHCVPLHNPPLVLQGWGVVCNDEHLEVPTARAVHGMLRAMSSGQAPV